MPPLLRKPLVERNLSQKQLALVAERKGVTRKQALRAIVTIEAGGYTSAMWRLVAPAIEAFGESEGIMERALKTWNQDFNRGIILRRHKIIGDF